MGRLLNALTVAGIVLLLCLPRTVLADESRGHSHECSLETLEGLYLFSATGFALVNGAWQPKAIVEYIQSKCRHR